MEEGVVLATDSRFTLQDGSFVDDGRKIYHLPPDAAAVAYAGDVPLIAQGGD